MADREESDDTLLDSILDEEAEEGGEGTSETEEQEGEESQGSEEEGEGESEEQETEAEGGEGPDDAEESGEDEGGEEEEAPRSRGQSRQQKLANENNRLRAELEAARRGGGQGNGGGNAQPGAQAPNPQQFRENLKRGIQEKLGQDFALIAPDQQADRLLGAMETILQPVVRNLQGNTFASNDRAQFYEDRAGNRWVQKNKGEIERRFQAALQQGFTVPREQIARDMAGEQALTGVQKNGGSSRRQASNRKAAARGTPTRGRGDTSGRSRRSDMEQLEDRLKDVKI